MIQANKYLRGLWDRDSKRKPATEPRPASQAADHSLLKPTLVLTTLLFLIVAPEPDSQDIAALTANFLAPQNNSALLASTEQVDPIHIEHRQKL